MKCETPTTNNIADILRYIITFTHMRRAILLTNIKKAYHPDFIPHDLPVDDFSLLVEQALTEHLLHQRLVWRDTDIIQFSKKGKMIVNPIVDTTATQLKQSDPLRYVAYIQKKLEENRLNRKIAYSMLYPSSIADFNLGSFTKVSSPPLGVYHTRPSTHLVSKGYGNHE